MKYERSITIAATPHDVFVYLVDFGRHLEWATPAHNLRLTPPSEVRAGATYTSVGKDMGRDSVNQVTITEVVPDRRLAYDAVMDNGQRWHNEIDIAPEGSGTRVTKRAISTQLPLFLGILGWILGPVLRAEGRKIVDGDLDRIAKRMERGRVQSRA